MKNLKRLIALVAVFALALTTIASAATFTDVAEDSAYYEAVETLTKLGIIDGYVDGTFKPEQTVTRAEMAKLIAAMQGFGSSAEGSSVTQFSDVPASHWASGYIANATGVAINGYPDGTFGPDDTVKYEQSVKMIMATLGYTVIANSNGGYPMGYVSAAIKEDVTKNVSNANVGTDANRGTVAQLIYNAIDTPLVEQTTWNADGSGEYTKYDGTGSKAYKTLMSENLDVVKMKGVVLANSYMSVNEAVTIDKEADKEVEIAVSYGYKVADNDFFDKDGDVINKSDSFLVGDSDAEDYVGKAVIFFALENDYDEWEIISIAEDSTYNKSVTFALADFDEDDTDSEEGEIYYYKNEASTGTKLNIQDKAKVLYNNAYYAGDVYALIAKLYKANYGGQVTVVDTDKTSGYDLIIVEAAVSAVVDDINKAKINLKDGVSLPNGGSLTKIDTDDDAVIVKLVKGGEEIALDAVAEDDVLSIVGVKDGGYMVVEVMSNIIEGTVSSKRNSTTSDDGKEYKINGEWYGVAAGATVPTINAGDAGMFYIDKYGKIAYYDETVSGGTGNYAYVIDTLVSVDDWGNQTAEIKMLTAEGVKTYKTTDKFDIDKVSYEVDELEPNASGEVAALTALEGALIDINMSGEAVKAIVTADQGEDDEFVTVGSEIKKGAYDADDLEIAGSIALDEDTIVFYVNHDVKTGAVKESKSYVGTLADLEDKAVLNGQAYANDSVTNDANILVLEDATATVSASTGIAVIVDIEDGTNEDDEDIYILTVLYNGEEVTLNTTEDVYDEVDEDALTIGDIVKIKVAGTVITNMVSVFDFAEDVREKNGGILVDDVDEDGKAIVVEGDLDDVFAYTNTELEYFDYGYVGKYSSSKKVTLFNGKSYKLSECDNIYVIDNNGRKIDLYAGAAADLTFDEDLVNTAGNAFVDEKIEIDGVKTYVPADVADLVIVRVYDNDTVEAVIIKGNEDHDGIVE